jgi:transcriptional regulator with XRE-family HTH domain
MTIEDFAEHLGMSSRAVAKWEAQRNNVPSMATQQLLDVVLHRAPEAVQVRFAHLAAHPGLMTPLRLRRPCWTSMLRNC